MTGVHTEALGAGCELEPGERPGAAASGVLQLLGDLVELARDLECLAGGEEDRGSQSLTPTATS
jgi:hypothetical protein